MFDRPTHANMHQFSTKPISFITCPNKFGIRCSVRLTSAKVALPSFKAYYIRYLWRQKSFMKHFCYISSFSLYTTKTQPTHYQSHTQTHRNLPQLKKMALKQNYNPPKRDFGCEKVLFLHPGPLKSRLKGQIYSWNRLLTCWSSSKGQKYSYKGSSPLSRSRIISHYKIWN